MTYLLTYMDKHTPKIPENTLIKNVFSSALGEGLIYLEYFLEAM